MLWWRSSMRAIFWWNQYKHSIYIGQTTHIVTFWPFPFFLLRKKYYSCCCCCCILGSMIFLARSGGKEQIREKNGNAQRNYYKANKCIGANGMNRKGIEGGQNINRIESLNLCVFFFGVIFFIVFLFYTSLYIIRFVESDVWAWLVRRIHTCDTHMRTSENLRENEREQNGTLKAKRDRKR